MARYTGPVCKLCRREGVKLYLKGIRCDTPKCAQERRNIPPGVQSQIKKRGGKMTDYAIHLREKQKVKRFYGVLERQFRRYFQMAERFRGNTGERLMQLLESRLDNVVHRLGFALSRRQARQMITHGHITVNGRRVTIPSYLLRPGDVVGVRPKPKSLERVQANLAEVSRPVPNFLTRVDGDAPQGHFGRLPSLEEVSLQQVQPQLIVEICSR